MGVTRRTFLAQGAAVMAAGFALFLVLFAGRTGLSRFTGCANQRPEPFFDTAGVAILDRQFIR